LNHQKIENISIIDSRWQNFLFKIVITSIKISIWWIIINIFNIDLSMWWLTKCEYRLSWTLNSNLMVFWFSFIISFRYIKFLFLYIRFLWILIFIKHNLNIPWANFTIIRSYFICLFYIIYAIQHFVSIFYLFFNLVFNSIGFNIKLIYFHLSDFYIGIRWWYTILIGAWKKRIRTFLSREIFL